MSEEKEKDNKENENSSAADIIRELGLITSGTGFKSDIQYINIIRKVPSDSPGSIITKKNPKRSITIQNIQI